MSKKYIYAAAMMLAVGIGLIAAGQRSSAQNNNQDTPNPVNYTVDDINYREMYPELFVSSPGSICGNGIVEPPDETCDDGNTLNGDGCSNVCQVENPVTNLNDSGSGSLRFAIANAPISITGNTILLINLTGTITLTSGELLINKRLTIQGTGANNLRVSGNNSSRVFNVTSGANLSLNGLTVTGGRITGGIQNYGGGIYNQSGTVTITNSTISGNSAIGGSSDNNGGGIANSNGTMTITNSTISGNSASGTFNSGGGIYNYSGTVTITNSTISGNSTSGGSGTINYGGGIYNQSGMMTITNSTISGNSASGSGIGNEGGGITNFGSGNTSGSTLTITNSTVSGNSASGGSHNNGGGIINNFISTLRIRNSIIAGNFTSGQGPDFLGTATSLGNNLIGNTANSSGFGAAGDIQNQNARLAPLGFYGGTTQTHALLSGSPAINTGNNCVTDLSCSSDNPPIALTTDQRGASRVGAVDIGAFEAPANLVVTNTNDSGSGSLRAAITTANADPFYDAITFAIPATDAGCTNGVCTITLTSGEFAIVANSALSINGTGADNLRVSGNNQSRVFLVNSGANLTMSGLTVTQGNTNCTGTPGCSGAGIRNRGTLNLTGVAVANNTINTASGGGIINEGTATIINSAITGNTGSSGGGFYNAFVTPAAVAYIINTTVSGNFAWASTGIYNNQGTLFLTNSTVTNNTATSGSPGGVENFSGVVYARNNIIAGNASSSGGPDYLDTMNSLGNNLIGNTTGANITGDTTGNITNVNARLAPLGFYGGTTQTHALLSGSPAINAGNNCVTNLTCSSNNPPIALTTDQRGAARVGNVDIGAFELNNSANGGSFVAQLPNGTENFAYNYQLVPNNGAFTYTVSGGALPNGINLTTSFAPDAVVALTGTPMQNGTFNFSITASDGVNTNITNYQLNVFGPTAASVSVSGRVLTNDGRGLRNAIVVMTDSQGETRTTRSNAFGYFRFTDVSSGETYIFDVRSKQYQFTTQVLYVAEDLTELNFVAVSEKSSR